VDIVINEARVAVDDAAAAWTGALPMALSG
jgi:hypothetical protein